MPSCAARGFGRRPFFPRLFYRSKKGFTLFTALVSILLIVLTVLLAQTMIRTERTVTDSVADIQEQQEMQAIADLARADAMQVFNFGVRYQIEQYLTNPDNSILLTPENVSWNEMVKGFAIANFGGTDSGVQFANRTANHLTNILGSGKGQDFKTFRLDLESNVELMRVVLQKLFQESVTQEDFFEVIDCPDGVYTTCVGTFYVNLNMSRLSDEDYEKLPQIRVLNRDSGRVIKEPILPRSNFRIYVPLRIFKALAGAKALAHTPNDAPAQDSSYVEHTESDFGLLSARIHNEFEEMKLGVCDPQNCGFRTDPYLSAAAPLQDGEVCPGATNFPNSLVGLDLSGLSQMGITYQGAYDFRSTQSMGDVLREIMKQRVNFIADSLAAQYGIGTHDGFEVRRLGPGTLSKVEVVTNAEPSKEITEVASAPTTTTSATTLTPAGNYPNASLGSGAACPTLAEGVGAYFGMDAEGNLEPQTEYVPIGTYLSAGALNALCTEATQFDAYLVFKETDEQYKVNKNNENVYTIRLHDGGLSSFTHRFEPQGAVCALPAKPVERSKADAHLDTDWTCVSVTEPSSVGLGATGKRGCYLPNPGTS